VPDLPTSGQTLRRYVLYQLPGLVVAAGVVAGLVRWTALPSWGAAALLVAWVMKDAALYPWLRSAYETDSRLVIERMIGLAGVAVEPLAPRGYVRVRGELWQAEPAVEDLQIESGHPITVDAVRDTTLLVRPRQS
jgi:membrane protein implicated in regulation of membrane protease activity